MRQLVAGVLLLALTACADPDQGRCGDGCADPDYPRGVRIESFGSVSVRVPAGWGLGYTCATSRAGPYVGRPGPCRAPAGRQPPQEAVWFASPLPVGHAESGGVPSETIAIGGQHLTVAVRSPSLRRRTLASASTNERADPNLCGLRAHGVGPGLVLRPRWQVREMSVCAYAEDGALVWSERSRHPLRAEAFRAAFLRASRRAPSDRKLPPPAVIVQLGGSAPGTVTSQEFALSFGPPAVNASDRTAPLTAALLHALRSAGLSLYVPRAALPVED